MCGFHIGHVLSKPYTLCLRIVSCTVLHAYFVRKVLRYVKYILIYTVYGTFFLRAVVNFTNSTIFDENNIY